MQPFCVLIDSHDGREGVPAQAPPTLSDECHMIQHNQTTLQATKWDVQLKPNALLSWGAILWWFACNT